MTTLQRPVPARFISTQILLPAPASKAPVRQIVSRPCATNSRLTPRRATATTCPQTTASIASALWARAPAMPASAWSHAPLSPAGPVPEINLAVASTPPPQTSPVPPTIILPQNMLTAGAILKVLARQLVRSRLAKLALCHKPDARTQTRLMAPCAAPPVRLAAAPAFAPRAPASHAPPKLAESSPYAKANATMRSRPPARAAERSKVQLAPVALLVIALSAQSPAPKCSAPD